MTPFKRTYVDKYQLDQGRVTTEASISGSVQRPFNENPNPTQPC